MYKRSKFSAVKRGNKYGARKTEVDGILFDSKRESEYYQELKLRLLAGDIADLVTDKKALRFPLEVNGVKIGKYTADFSWLENGERIVCDVKGMKTRDYILRKKLMLACHGISIKEIN